MLNRAVWCWALAFGVLLGWASSPFAQLLVDAVPSEFEDPVEAWASGPEVESSPFHRQRFVDVHAERIRNGQIFAVASEMISTFEAVDWAANEPQQAKINSQLHRFLAAVQVALNTPGIEGPLETSVEQSIFLAAINREGFGLHSLRQEALSDAAGNEVAGYFAGTPNELRLYEWVEQEEQFRLLLTSEEVRQWRLLQNALSNLVTTQVALVSEENIQTLRVAVERWENFLEKGYSQMPWESLVNGWAIPPPGPPKLGPPDRQWVILHPSVGLELSADKLDETRVKEAMHVEALGHVWYRGDRLENYWGVSAIVSLREDLDPGIGVLVHIKRNWNLGATWHDVERDPFLCFSVDLFRFAKDEAPKYVEKYQGLRKQLGLN